MNTNFSTRLTRVLILGLFTSAVLIACGGGGGKDSANNGSVASSYTGPITGFGSVIVNGMRFSSVGAGVADEDGTALNASNLRLGSVVRIEGSGDDTTLTGSATQIVAMPSMTGTVDSVNVVGNQLTVMGQTVTVNAQTNFVGYTALSGIAALDFVEVHGLQAANGTWTATLLEKKTNNAAFALRGTIANLNTVAKTFVLNALTVNYSGVTAPSALANGSIVKVKAITAPIANVLTATAVKTRTSASEHGLQSGTASAARVKLKGMAAAAPIANVISVSGVSVNLNAATFQGGTLASIAAGSALEITGSWTGSVLQASKVEFEGSRSSSAGGNNELYGAVTSFTSLANFTVQGVVINASNVAGISASQLAVGTYLEVKGNMNSGTFIATRIEFKSSSVPTGGYYEIYGVVSNYLSLSDFTINGVRVNASAAYFEHGGTVSNGRFVEVKGSTNASGIFVATKIEVK
jgi:Domain of unknown function (DUF5666)